ncbi:MAG: RDD family protein [Ardenticatenaceae bacterium]
MDEFLALETPEQLEINYTIARLGSRFIAALWDSLAIGLLQFMLLFAGALLVSVLNVDPFASNWGIALMVLLSFLLLWGYYVIFEVILNGQTPGKRLAGIRTVRQDGYPIGFGESVIRNIIRVVDFLPFAYGLGVLVMFIDRRSRRLGDFAAGTLVVHDRLATDLRTIRAAAVTDERLLMPALPNLDRLASDEVEAARRFLQRKGTLTNEDSLANHLAAHFRERLELPPDDSLTDTELIRRVLAQYRR